MAEKRTDAVARQQGTATTPDQQLRRRAHPVSLIERFADEMDRMFDDFGIGRSRVPRWGNPTGIAGSALRRDPAGDDCGDRSFTPV
jgi:hypothetical protein